MQDPSTFISFLYEVADSLQRTSDAARLKSTAFREADGFLPPEYLLALEKLFDLAAREEVDERELRELLKKGDRDAPTAEELAAASYLRATLLQRRRRAAAGA